MKTQVIINPEELSEQYLFANTPMYLYQKFRESDAVFELSNLNTSDIVKQYNEIAQRYPKTFKEIITAYALLISLSFKDYSEVKESLNKLEKNGLDWAPQIIQFMADTTKLSQEIYVRIQRPEPQISLSNNKNISETQTVINLTPKPRVYLKEKR